MKTGVFGAGAMGRHHVRLLGEIDGSELVGLHDPDPEAAARMAEAHGVRCFDDAAQLAQQVEAAVVAAPTLAHEALADRLFAAGAHVLVEKPLAPSLAAADRMIEAARRAGKVLAVGHVEFFNPAVQALVVTARGGATPRYVEIERLSPFSPRSLDVDVVLDLMIHDLQILHALDPSPVAEIRATGIEVLSPKIDMANVRLAFESGCVANLTTSRVSQEPVRRLRLFARDRYYSLDYRAQEIKGFRLEGVDADPLDPEGGRRIVPTAPDFEAAEPLRGELEGFLAACRGESPEQSGAPPVVTGEAGRQALSTALAVVDEITRPG